MQKIHIINLFHVHGIINKLHLPGGNGVRVDSGIYQGYEIPIEYDSMIAKIITKGNTREDTILKMKRAIEECIVEGISTNREFLLEVLNNKEFVKGNYNTSFIQELVKNNVFMKGKITN